MDETSFLETDSFLDLPSLRLVSKDIHLKILGTMYLSDGKKGYQNVNMVGNVVFRINNYYMCTLAFLREDVVVALDKTESCVFLFDVREEFPPLGKITVFC